MRLKEIMSSDVAAINADATLQEAARKMKLRDVGSLPALRGDRLVGILTDRDITVRATADGRDPRTARVRDFMTPDVVSCREDEDVADAARLMVQNRIRRVVVVDAEGRLAGVVSISDMAVDARVDEEVRGQVLKVLREVSVSSGFESY